MIAYHAATSEGLHANRIARLFAWKNRAPVNAVSSETAEFVGEYVEPCL
jgi:hypothetical protein